MRRIKSLNILTILAFIWSMFGVLTPVYAASATVGFSGNSTVAVGSNITVKMYVSNVTDAVGGVVSVGGNLSFDSEYLEYVSGTGTTTPYTFQINTGANYIIAGLDTTLSNGITGSSQTTVFTFVFKAKKVGTTQVTLTNAKISDTSSKITSNISPKTITITGASSSPTPTTSPSPTTSPTPTTSPSPTTTPDNKSSDATLKSLSASGYTLSPSFSSKTTSYTIKVPSSATTVKLEGSATDSKATVSGLGNITLTGDTTTAKIKVTAEDGTTKTYTVKIEKESTDNEDKDSDATLKKLDISGYTLSPTFKSSVTTYSMKVKNNITSLKVDAIPNSDKAKVQISGNKNWEEGVNVVTIKVTAEDGSTKTYTVNVTRESSNPDKETTSKSNDNYLKSLTINSSHEISPKFSKKTTTYDVTVPYEVDKLDLSYVTNNSKAKVTVTGNEDFKVGKVNTVEIEVQAEDGTIRVYTLNVTRSTEESGTDLKDITIGGGATLSPKFDPENLEYEVKVDGDTDELDITAIAKDSDSEVEIIGNKNLKEGHNTVLVKVTDKNGFTKYYTIDVVKEAKQATILGLTPLQFGVVAGIIGLLLLLLILLLLRRRKDKEEINEIKEEKPFTPIIEVKPEFNFGSKNTSDDDIVHGNFNQNSDLEYENKIPERRVSAIEADYEENIPYDPYDDTVTKRELVDAIHEATRTKDPSKLKMLLEQDALNQKKKEIRRREELRNQERDMDDWR